MTHWTEEKPESFLYSIAADFVEQIMSRMKSRGVTRSQLAKLSKISKGRVSQIMNNPGNLTLDTMTKFSRALGMKVSILAYDDGDIHNERGPIFAQVFERCWKEAGSPKDFWHWNEKELSSALSGDNDLS